jgi:hypothetical protein
VNGKLVRGLSGLLLPGAVVVGGTAALLLVVADSWGGRLLGFGFFVGSVCAVLLPFAIAPGGDPPGYEPQEISAFQAWQGAARRQRLRVLLPAGVASVVALFTAFVAAPAATEPPTRVVVHPRLRRQRPVLSLGAA